MKIPAFSLLLLISSNPVTWAGSYNGGLAAFIVDNGIIRKNQHKYMALTEEFIRIKEGNEKQVDNSGTVGDGNSKLSDALGYSALNTVKMIARSTGIGEKFGSNSTRSEFINWQRENLREVRRNIGRGTLLQSRDIEELSDGGVESNGGVRKMLIKALPSNNKPSGQDNKKRGRRSTDNKPDDRPTTISTALQTLERDMTILDNLASLQPQLSLPEVGLLLGAVTASGIGPIAFPGTSVTEVLAPAAAACKYRGIC
jgi:hypothetical protein